VAGQRLGGQKEERQGRTPAKALHYIHSAVDAHSRLAYSEVRDNETATTAVAFWRRAHAFFADYGITVERVLTDYGSCYRSKDVDSVLVAAAIAHTRTRPYRPQTNRFPAPRK